MRDSRGKPIAGKKMPAKAGRRREPEDQATLVGVKAREGGRGGRGADRPLTEARSSTASAPAGSVELMNGIHPSRMAMLDGKKSR